MASLRRKRLHANFEYMNRMSGTLQRPELVLAKSSKSKDSAIIFIYGDYANFSWGLINKKLNKNKNVVQIEWTYLKNKRK